MEYLNAVLARERIEQFRVLFLDNRNRLLADAEIEAEMGVLADALAARTALTIVVSNEVGLGIVPDNALARRFRDAAGAANQMLAARAGRVDFIAAGLPLRLK